MSTIKRFSRCLSTPVFIMNISTFALVILVICLWCFFYWRPRRRIWAAARCIPGPKLLPLIGNALLFDMDSQKSFSRLVKLREEFGSVVRLWVADQLIVLLSDPEDIKCLLRFPKILNRDHKMSLALMPFLGNGLLTVKNDEWRIHRKLMSPMFHYKVLESYVEIFGAKAKILVEKLEELADGKPFDINEKLSLCALDAICETVVGLASNTQEVGNSDYQKAHKQTTKFFYHRLVFPWQLISWLYPLTIDGRRAKTNIKTIFDFNRDIIARKLTSYHQGVRHPGVKTGSGKIVTSFVDMLIEAGETHGTLLTDQEMLDEVTTTTSTGLVSTSSTMSTLLILIAIHPEWQDTLFAEMTEVFADDMTRPATNHDLSKMPVLDRVLRETLRMYPIVGVITRQITEDVELPSGYLLPAGSSALVVHHSVHRDPKNYPKPNEFLPDRWLPDSGINNHTYAYIPFSAGARHCIAQKYSLLQMKSTISQLVRYYKMATDLTMDDLEKQKLSYIIRLPTGGYQLKLEKRVAGKGGEHLN